MPFKKWVPRLDGIAVLAHEPWNINSIFIDCFKDLLNRKSHYCIKGWDEGKYKKTSISILISQQILMNQNLTAHIVFDNHFHLICFALIPNETACSPYLTIKIKFFKGCSLILDTKCSTWCENCSNHEGGTRKIQKKTMIY